MDELDDGLVGNVTVRDVGIKRFQSFCIYVTITSIGATKRKLLMQSSSRRMNTPLCISLRPRSASSCLISLEALRASRIRTMNPTVSLMDPSGTLARRRRSTSRLILSSLLWEPCLYLSRVNYSISFFGGVNSVWKLTTLKSLRNCSGRLILISSPRMTLLR